MPALAANLIEPIGGFPIEGRMMRYSLFVPRLYNYCKSLGMEAGKIMPSRAFCSDESQGYPIIMITKHFGTFPFNHGQVGGIVATDRHGPHAAHGKDMVLIQASHVGYDPDADLFGVYRRIQTEGDESSHSCGKIHGVLEWYRNEYDFASQNVYLDRSGDDFVVTIDNQLLKQDREEGLFLQLGKLLHLDADSGNPIPLRLLSTAKVFRASDYLVQRLGEARFCTGQSCPIGAELGPDLFRYTRNLSEHTEWRDHLEQNLLPFMPFIITSTAPELTAAQINTQIEFDRTYRSIVKSGAYKGKKLVFVAGLHIDISPRAGQLFPLTKFIPWAAYIQERDGSHFTLEQDELVSLLMAQSHQNPDQINLEAAIHAMAEAAEVRVHTH